MITETAVDCKGKTDAVWSSGAKLIDASASARLYFRGLGLGDFNSWLGKHRTRLVTDWFPSGRAQTEYLYDFHGAICMGVTYFENGRIESLSPFSQDEQGQAHDDGLLVRYYQDGRIELEEGRRPGGDCLARHGVSRKRAPNGRVLAEHYYINDRECTPAEWLHWVGSHPADVRYAGDLGPGPVSLGPHATTLGAQSLAGR